MYFLYRFILVKLGYENPFSCIIKATSRCGLNCSHCPWPKNQNREMATAEVKGKINEAHRLGCVSVVFEGGEPTLRSDLADLINYAKSKKMSVILITNGQNDFGSYNADSICISVEGDKTTHEKIRGENTFEKIQNNVKKSKSQNIIILTTLSQANSGVLEEVPKNFPRQTIFYNFMYPYREVKDSALTKDEARRTAGKIISLKRIYKNIGNSGSYLKNVGVKAFCYDWYTFLVNYDGQSRIGCTVEMLETPVCDECYMLCGAEICHALRARPDAARAMMRLAGFNFKKIFSRQ